MIDLAMDTPAPALDLSTAPFDVITRVLGSMSLTDRFTCALVCKSWTEAATAATHSIVLRDRVQNLSCLQAWMDQHGGHLEVLQLHKCDGAALTALPCPQLQDLLLRSSFGNPINICSRVSYDIAAATKISSVSLSYVMTHSQQADVVSALTALPDLQRLFWCGVWFGAEAQLSDSSLLQQTTWLTYLELQAVIAAALQHVSSLTKLQHLTISAVEGWAAAGCPGLQELKALTSLKLYSRDDIPASISQLTALQELWVSIVTPAAATGLQALTALTQLKVRWLRDLADNTDQSLQLQLNSLQHLELGSIHGASAMPMSFVAGCKQIHVLSLHSFDLKGPGSLVASTMLQHLELNRCRLSAAGGAARSVSWQQVFPGPEQLPHLTSLQLTNLEPDPQQSDLECIVAACRSSLQVLHLDTLQDSYAPVVAQLPALTSLHLVEVTDADCGPLAQLTWLKELRIKQFALCCTIGMRQLAALDQLTSLGFYQGCDLEVVGPVLQEQLSDKLPGCSYAIANKAPAGYPSDVPSRLLRACDITQAAGQ